MFILPYLIRWSETEIWIKMNSQYKTDGMEEFKMNFIVTDDVLLYFLSMGKLLCIHFVVEIGHNAKWIRQGEAVPFLLTVIWHFECQTTITGMLN